MPSINTIMLLIWKEKMLRRSSKQFLIIYRLLYLKISHSPKQDQIKVRIILTHFNQNSFPALRMQHSAANALPSWLRSAFRCTTTTISHQCQRVLGLHCMDSFSVSVLITYQVCWQVRQSWEKTMWQSTKFRKARESNSRVIWAKGGEHGELGR